MTPDESEDEHRKYVTIIKFGDGDYSIVMMTWDESDEEYVVSELAGTCETEGAAEEYAKEWAAEEKVDYR